MNKKFFISFFLLISCSYSQAAIVISGQPGTGGQPFPFTIRATAYDPKETVLYLGANQPISDDAFKSQAISFVANEDFVVTGITPEKIALNNNDAQDNPLYGKKIDFLALSGSSDLFVVTHDQNTQVTAVRNVRTPLTRAAYQSKPLQAGDGITSGIVGLTTGVGQEVRFSSGKNDFAIIARQRFFAAVRPHAGSFGLPGSGIAEGVLNVTDVGSKEKDKETVILNYSLDQSPFVPLDITSSALKIGADLASIDNDAHAKDVVMISSHPVIFTGLFVTGGAAVGDGARAVTIAKNQAIAPDAAIENDSIIGGRTTTLDANVQVSVHFLGVLLTSTLLPYVVVVGGVGAPDATARSVYALPLDDSGVLAKKTAVPQTMFYTDTAWPWIKARFFKDPATGPGDLFSPSAPDIYKARVGGNGTLPGDITSLFVEKDAVYVTVGTDSATEKAGVFYSQALFDVAGALQGWTDWHRATGAIDQMFGVALDNKRGTFWLLPGTDIHSLNTLKKTVWQSPGLSSFNVSLQDSFAQLATGSQGFFDIAQNNAAFSQTGGTRISVIGATGYRKVVVLQSGADEGTLFTPTTTIADVFESHDGTLAGFSSPVQKIDMTGGVLDELGSIIAADIVSDGISSWLVVGGSFGAAVLTNPDGSGWPVGTLEKGFVNLPSTLRWTKFGDFKQVRKIIADGSNLYILTSSGLYRIAASATVFSDAGNQTGVTLAQADHLLNVVRGNGTFSDVIISSKFALLATSIGLFRVGNGADISQAPNEDLVSWQWFDLPESSGPVTRLYAISPTGIETDVARDIRGGNIYILQGNVALAQARVYRCVVQDISCAAVTDETVQLFNDMFVKDHVSMYFNRGDYRNYLATDGAVLMMTRSRYEPKIPSTKFKSTLSFLEIINPSVKTGERRAAAGSMFFDIKSHDDEKPSRHVGPVIQRSATGSWMAAGTYLMVGE